ncbi:MAG TPA: N-acetylmuramic acid 6-phosphate etherase [Phycisphaerales bacterium]|nr:N-acetylmuramic acid 6-phosphate etherase [Phycisphaerales bacterium]
MTTSASNTPPDRSHISTEKRNPRTMHLHTLSTREIVELIHQEDREVLHALKRAGKTITRFIEAAEPGFTAGGRLIYVGAGTSGRLGVLDASEAPPTFQVDPGKIVGLIAGGDAALRKSSESKEDDPRGAWPELEALALTQNDTVLAIAAGGTTPYARGALEYCKHLPAGQQPLTGLLVCTTMDPPASADHLIMLKTGPEVLTGSTRMKAGTATKLTLNTISTTLMVRSGRVYQNLMVDVRATNDKLKDRAARIVATLTGLARESSFELLESAGGSVKTAVVMHRRGLPRTEAEAELERCSGHLGRALSE